MVLVGEHILEELDLRHDGENVNEEGVDLHGGLHEHELLEVECVDLLGVEVASIID